MWVFTNSRVAVSEADTGTGTARGTGTVTTTNADTVTNTGVFAIGQDASGYCQVQRETSTASECGNLPDRAPGSFTSPCEIKV